MKTNCNVKKIATTQEFDYATGFQLDHPYFKENYKLILMDLSKQQTVGTDPKAIHQINFTGNLKHDEGLVSS